MLSLKVTSLGMKAISISVALLGLVAVSTAESLRDHLNMMSMRTTAAIKRKDMKGFASCMKMCTTKDFKYSENGQTMTLDQMLEGMKMGVTKVPTFFVNGKMFDQEATVKTLSAHINGLLDKKKVAKKPATKAKEPSLN